MGTEIASRQSHVAEIEAGEGTLVRQLLILDSRFRRGSLEPAQNFSQAERWQTPEVRVRRFGFCNSLTQISRNTGLDGLTARPGFVRGPPAHFPFRRAPSEPAPYFFTVNSTFAVPLATVTDCVVTLPSSLQVFNVYVPAGTSLISNDP